MTTCLAYAFCSVSPSGTSDGLFTHGNLAEKALIVCRDSGEALFFIGDKDNGACQHPNMNSEHDLQISQSIQGGAVPLR